MGRAPCCEKMGLKKGPWTPEEDRILINYINSYGHPNWRALPKHAGLLRCGKSCRLRWTNYLRPDIKRGNFTREEEEAIINLHEMLGNRWSAIAARLPGRTDNEIKNVWHTHLKKRLPHHKQQSQDTIKRKHNNKQTTNLDDSVAAATAKQEQQQQQGATDTKQDPRPLSPPQCSSTSDVSTLTTTDDHDENNINGDMSKNNNSNGNNNDDNVDYSVGSELALDEDFWSEVLSADNSGETSDDFPGTTIEQEFQFSTMDGDGDGMKFWYDVYSRAEELTELLEL